MKLHKIDKKPKLGVFLLTLQSRLFVYYAGGVLVPLLAIPFLMVATHSQHIDETDPRLVAVSSVCMIIMAIILLIIQRKRYAKEYRGCIAGADGKLSLLLALPFVLYWCVILFLYISKDNFTYPNIFGILTSLGAGIGEETMYRIVPIGFAMRHRNNKGIIPFTVLITTVYFGLSHAMNFFAGATVEMTVFQVLATTCIGALLAAVYLRTGSGLLVMAVHSLNDIIASTDAAVGSALTYKIGLRTTDKIDFCCVLVMFVLALILLRPSKHEDIRKRWDIKFNGAIAS